MLLYSDVEIVHVDSAAEDKGSEVYSSNQVVKERVTFTSHIAKYSHPKYSQQCNNLLIT